MKIHYLDKEKIDKSLLDIISHVVKQQIYCLRYYDENQQCFINPNTNKKIVTREQKEKETISFLHKHISEQLLYYRNVCILEKDGEFKLSYGNDERIEFKGTGPFKTLEEAENWFYKNGR